MWNNERQKLGNNKIEFTAKYEPCKRENQRVDCVKDKKKTLLKRQLKILASETSVGKLQYITGNMSLT